MWSEPSVGEAEAGAGEWVGGTLLLVDHGPLPAGSALSAVSRCSTVVVAEVT